ncbi:metallophosphoesterase [Neorhodopirellula lusitana]|uniref:metallophosphoesterase n=1 Tax=Neorhodopirellula lusitana TaxID=445327 RepID=UPI00384C403E
MKDSLLNTNGGPDDDNPLFGNLDSGSPASIDSLPDDVVVNMKAETVRCNGLMFIGDPHLEARVPGFRCDDYPQVALRKFAWCLEYARQKQLQPILLGDLFHLPQDNPNWMIAEIIDTISRCYGKALPAIYGNHDVRENIRKPNDSISILFAAGHLRLITPEHPWQGTVDGRSVTVGGTVWGDRLPKSFKPSDVTVDDENTSPDLVAWITHHDILIPGYEESGRIRPSVIPGVDMIVNGHIHRRLDHVVKTDDGKSTVWVTAGNITRRARSDASRSHVPAVVCVVPAKRSVSIDDEIVADESIESIDVVSQGGSDWRVCWVRVPHEPFDDVFHDEIQGEDEEQEEFESGFVADLRELTRRKTDTGAGLIDYLDQNLDQFDDAVAAEIRRLADEVTSS